MWTLIVMALAALLWLVVVTLGYGAESIADEFSMTAIRLVAMGLTALAVAQLLQRFLSYVLLSKKPERGPASSDLVRSVMNATLYLIVGVLFLRYGLGQDVTSVLATSAIVTVIMGLALQPTLGHLFSGVSIEIERPFRIGDFVRRDDLEGRVTSLSWRSVSIETDRGTKIVIPNAEFTGRSVEIIRASQPSRHQIVFHMASDCSPNRVIRLAMDVLRSDLSGVVQTPAPSVVILGVDPLTGTLRFGARFFTPNFLDRTGIASLFMERLWFSLSRAGLSLPQRLVMDGFSEESAGNVLSMPKNSRNPSSGAGIDAVSYNPAHFMPMRSRPTSQGLESSQNLQRLVAAVMAGVPIHFREELRAQGHVELYGPHERCRRGLVGFVVQGRLIEDRLPEPDQRAQALTDLRAQVASTATTGTVRMDSESFDLFVRRGALAIGPLAHTLCQRIALCTDDLSLAHEMLADSITDTERRKSFMAQSPAQPKTRIDDGSWFGWSGLLELDEDSHVSCAGQECAVFVWADEPLRQLLGRATERDLQVFTEFLQTQAVGCQALSVEHVTRWCSRGV